MNRVKASEILPVIKDFANGEHIEIWDSVWLNSEGKRGCWLEKDDIGFGASSISNYRKIINNKFIYYYDNRPLKKL